MPDILHTFSIQAPCDKVFAAISKPAALDAWWTQRSSGTPGVDGIYELDFGPGSIWRAKVLRCEPPSRIEWELVSADADWTGTRVAFELEPSARDTTVRFAHAGWKESNTHFRQSSYCWAMYLRLLRRFVERGEVVPYANRLEV